jgi:hypothetical protein
MMMRDCQSILTGMDRGSFFSSRPSHEGAK